MRTLEPAGAGGGEDARIALIAYYRFSGRSLDRDREWHLSAPGGVLVEDRELVLMARPVVRNARYDWITDPAHAFFPEVCDAWFIHLMIGVPPAVARRVPCYRQYPYVCYLRGARGDGRLRTGPVSRMFERISKMNKHTQ